MKNFEPQNTILRYCWKILTTRFDQLDQFPTQVETEWLLIALAPPGAGTEFLTTLRETVVPALFSQTWTDVTGDMLEKLLFDLERDRLEGQVKQVRSLADLKKLQTSFTQLEDALTYNARTYIKPFSDSYIMNPLSIIREFWGDPIPLGMGEWDTTWLQGGVRIGELLTLIASTNGGKAQPLGAPVLTPTGYIPMGEVKVGTVVVDKTGKPTTVVAIHPQGIKEVYRVDFTDGTSTECCRDHLWETRLYYSDKWCVKSTAELALDIAINDPPQHCDDSRRARWHIPMTQPVEFSRRDLPIDPYLLGALLGNGCFVATSLGFSTGDEDLIDKLSSLIPSSLSIKKVKSSLCGYNISGTGGSNELIQSLKSAGLWRKESAEKFIPSDYLYGDIEQRKALLAGVLDTDGHARKNGGVEYVTASSKLAAGVRWLTESLGGNFRRQKDKVVKGVRYIRCYLKYNFNPFTLERKAKAWKQVKPPSRMITSICYVGNMPCQCITVASSNSTYLTNNFIVTHNSLCLFWWAISMAMRGYLTIYVSLDNVMGELLSRAFCAVSGIPMDETMDVSEDTYSQKLRIALSCYPSLRDNFILEKWPRGTKKCRDIRRLVDQVEQDEGRKVKAVYTDYGDCLRSEHTFKDPRFGLDEIFSDMASMAEEMKFTHLTATQANRAGKWIDGDIDTVAESWQKMWHTTTGVVLWRNKLEAMQGLARLLVGKARRTRVNYVVPVVMDPNNMRVLLDTNRQIQFRAQVEQMAEEAARDERKRKKKGDPTPVETMPPIGTNFIAPQTRPLLLPTPPQIWLPPRAGVV